MEPQRSHTRVLLVEDDKAHAVLIEDALAAIAADISRAESAKAAFELLSEQEFDVAVLDVGLPDASGFEIHRWAQLRAGAPSIVFVTADDTLEHAVEALRQGAAHYVVKRRNYLQRVVEAVSAALRDRSNPAANLRSSSVTEALVGVSPAIEGIRQEIADYAASSATVLISGETGTGKELVARAIHQRSIRSTASLVAINCAGGGVPLLDSLIVEMADGRGDPTGTASPSLREVARGGTLLLDEIGDVPLEMQAKYLRLLDPQPPSRMLDFGSSSDVRVIATTTHSLEEKVRKGEFRSDLFHRLNVLRLHLPPLRERREDIPSLAAHFLAVHGRTGSQAKLTREAIAQLMAGHWHGNVRELEHVIQRTLAHWTAGPIYCCDLNIPAADLADVSSESVPRLELVTVLMHHRGRLGPVAKRFGVSIRTIQRRMLDYKLNLRDFRRSRR